MNTPLRTSFLRIPFSIQLFSWVWSLIFFGFGVFLPLFFMICRVHSFNSLMNPVLLEIVFFTLKQAIISTALSAFIGAPLGIWIGYCGLRKNSSWINTLLELPFSVPTLIAAMTWISWLGRSGILSHFSFFNLNWGYSIYAVILAHVFFNIPWIALHVSRAFSDIPQLELDVSSTLGASSLSQIRWIVWPYIKWPFFSAATQVHLFCVMSFAIILLLGGGPPVETLETSLYSRIRFGTLDMTGAIHCAIWETILTLIPWMAVIYFQHKEKQKNLLKRQTRTKPFHKTQSFFKNLSTGTFPLFIVSLFTLPYFIIFKGLHWSNSLDPELIQQILSSARISLQIALSTGFLTLFTAICALIGVQSLTQRWKNSFISHFFTVLISLPGAFSILVLGLGIWITYGKWFDPFEGSLLAIILLQASCFFTIAFRSLWPIAQKSRTRLMEVAITLGASPLQAFWQIERRRWMKPLFSTFAMISGASLGEVAAVSLFYNEKLIPLPLLISRLMAQYRFDEAEKVSSILFLLCLFTLAGISRTFKFQVSPKHYFVE